MHGIILYYILFYQTLALALALALHPFRIESNRIESKDKNERINRMQSWTDCNISASKILVVQ
jgi:hypothetical protein